MEKVLIAGSSRTPIGIFDGKLKDYREQALGVMAVKDLLKKTGIAGEDIDEAVIGIAKQTSSPSNCARYIVLDADIPEKVPAYTVQRQGASGLQAVANGYLKIKTGNADVILAGGAESMTQIPLEIHDARYAFTPETRIIFDPIPAQVAGSQPADKYGSLTLLDINDKIAAHYGFTEEVQARYAEESLAKAQAKQLDEALIPVSYKEKKAVLSLTDDERCTAPGKVAGPADAAAMCLLISARAAEKNHTPVLAELVSVGFSAGDPAGTGMVGAEAITMALKKAGITAAELELIEINEITAAQSLAAIAALGLPEGEADKKVNVFGGALATGNAWGAAGAIALHRLLYGLKAAGKTWGLVVCGAEGGQAVAAVLKTV